MENKTNINPEIFPDAEAQDQYAYNGAARVEEWVDMPDSFATTSGADEPFVINEQGTLTDIQTEKATPSQFEALPLDDRLYLSVIGTAIGSLALGKERVVTEAKGRFANAVGRYRSWRESKSEKPQDTTETPLSSPLETSHFVKAAEAARAAGDWTGYQRELLKFADAADASKAAEVLSPEALRSRVRRADARVSGVDAGSNTLANQTLLEAKDDAQKVEIEATRKAREQLKKSWVDASNVLDLRRSIDEVVAKNPSGKTAEAVKNKMLEEYFGSYSKDLESGTSVSIDIQDKVNDMLDLPEYELRAIVDQNEATHKKTQESAPESAPNNVIPFKKKELKPVGPKIEKGVGYVWRNGKYVINPNYQPPVQTKSKKRKRAA